MPSRYSGQRNNNRTVAVLLPLAFISYLAYRYTAAPNSTDYVLPYSYNPTPQPKLSDRPPPGVDAPQLVETSATAVREAFSIDPSEVEELYDSLLRVPAEEAGKIAICASIHNEGRFISEWLLYNRAIGVDRFYLYDTGSEDETLSILQPWIEAGTVVLHRFKQDQVRHFQTNSLRTCSYEYAETTDWMLDCDVDEFYVLPHSLQSYSRTKRLHPADMPDKPLLNLLEKNWLYQTADVVAVSRITYKNGGIRLLEPESSVLEQQHLRDIFHSIRYEKLDYTKSIIHTNRKKGWVIPGAHYVRHNTLPHTDAKVITADGQSVPVEVDHYDWDGELKTGVPKGTMYKGLYPSRAFEPVIMYHYVERDLENCLAKLRRAKKVRKGGWRDAAGEEGCKNYELYQEDETWVPVHEKDGFYGAAMRDFTMADSFYGQYLPALIRISHERARTLSPGSGMSASDPSTLKYQPRQIDPHPDLVADWKQFGYDLVWGESKEEREEEAERVRKEKEKERKAT